MNTAGKPIECKAAVCWGPKEPLVIETVTVDVPKDNEIRFKLVATGICSSDLTMQDGNVAVGKFPVIFGHESAAVVESVGKAVTSVQIGDAIIPVWASKCGKCQSCLTGTRNLCDSMFLTMNGRLFDGSTRVKCKGQDVGQYMMVAGFSEYGVIPDGCVVKIPSGISLEKAAIYGCCVPTGYGAVKNTAKVRPGSTVAIYGLGAIGLCVSLGSRAAKASKIIGIDVKNEKEDIGKRMGCTDFINPLEHPEGSTEMIKKLTGGTGVDYAFVCVGKGSVVGDALNAIRMNCGEVIVLGVASQGDTFPLDTAQLIFGKSLKGTWCGDCDCSKDIPELLDLYVKGELNTDPLITHVLPLDKINEGFDMLRKTQSVRAIIKF